MDDICKEIEKVLKAGIGAVAFGVEKAQEAVDSLAQKGEPIYQQAKTAVAGAADKVVKSFNEIGKPKLENLLKEAKAFSLAELKELREKLGQLIDDMEQKQTQEESDPLQEAAEKAEAAPATEDEKMSVSAEETLE